MDLKELYEKIDEFMDKEIELSGWIRNHRKQKEFGFIDFSDGTCFKLSKLYMIISYLILIPLLNIM